MGGGLQSPAKTRRRNLPVDPAQDQGIKTPYQKRKMNTIRKYFAGQYRDKVEGRT